jgi:hypothetical protein
VVSMAILTSWIRSTSFLISSSWVIGFRPHASGHCFAQAKLELKLAWHYS